MTKNILIQGLDGNDVSVCEDGFNKALKKYGNLPDARQKLIEYYRKEGKLC